MASTRIPLVGGNWKMNFDHLEATYFVQKLVWLLRDAHFDFKRCEVALFPSFTSLRSVQVLVEAHSLYRPGHCCGKDQGYQHPCGC